MGIDLIEQRLQMIESYINLHGYESYDPYDGLSAPLAPKLIGKNQLGLRVWQQAVRLSPFNVRGILGVPKIAHTKTISDFASAYALLYLSTQDARYQEKTSQLLNRLAQLTLPVVHGQGWGLRFPFATRFVHANDKTPNIFQTINAIHAFLDGYVMNSEHRWLDIALQGFEFAKYEIGYFETKEHISWRYWKGLDTVIYNVSGMMLGLTARLLSITGEVFYADIARKLFTFLSHVQNPDGSWFYSADARGHWVDGFHTGYILEGLSRAAICSVIDRNNECLIRGTKYYLEKMFSANGFPKYYPGKFYPIDIQNIAQAIQTLVFLKKLEQVPSEFIYSVIQKMDSVLWNQRGYYNFMKSELFTYTTPMHRWSTGPMFLALVYAKQMMGENNNRT